MDQINCDDDILFFYNGIPTWGIVIGIDSCKNKYNVLVDNKSIEIKESFIQKIKKFLQ